ncbi:MAG: DNA polymerase IV [Verrucomicrobiota bacterium]|jgi:DNA polymerase-4|nr:MAG: DNA polymerase IV [Verrucomicrobiota bacterium]
MAELPLIVHLDADAFFVACEQAKDPTLLGKVCAVGGRERGIIASASYEARAKGVYTPMPTSKALKLCPDLIIIPVTPGLYSEISNKMFDLCETLTPYVERNSIDEGYLDLSICGFKTIQEVETAVKKLQVRIMTELCIPISMGIASNKLISQIASKLRKPKGFVVIACGTEADFLYPLSVGKLPGIGTKTELYLKEQGVTIIKDLFHRSDSELESILGSHWRDVMSMARGEDTRRVETEEVQAKSYSEQETFSVDLKEFEAVERIIKRMLDSLMNKLRLEGRRARTLTLKIRYPDFSDTSHGQSLALATDLESEFYPLVKPLLKEVWKKKQALRLVSVRISGVDEGESQLEMFSQVEDKRRKLAGVLDRLNAISKDGVVKKGHQLEP